MNLWDHPERGMEAVLSWVPRSGARGWGLEVSVQSREHCQWGAMRGWGEGGGLSGACPGALPQGPWRVTCTPLSVPSGGKRVGWGFLCPHSPGSVAAPGVRGLNPPPLKGDPHGAMGASLVKGRGHEPRTAALTGQGSIGGNLGGTLGGTPRAASQRDHLGEEATVVGVTAL